MKSMRIALLAAAALAVVPGAAYADRQDRRDHDQGDHADRGNRGGDNGRPAPPQGQHGSGMMVMPRAAPDNGPRPAPSQAPQSQFRPQAPGGSQWSGRGPGSQGRGDVRMERPTPIPNADTGQARAQWRQDDRRGDNRNDGRPNDYRHGDNDRGQWNGADHRDDRGQWNGTHNRDDRSDNRRWDNGDHGQWNNADRRGDGRRDRGGSWNGDHGGRPGGNDHRWDAGRWRNDHRYDWHGWRDSHRNLFSRHYYAPRGYHYRSVYAGFFLEPFFYGSSYWLDDPYDDYRLPPVNWPLRWIHYYNDALLVDVTTGEVVDVIPNFFF